MRPPTYQSPRAPANEKAGGVRSFVQTSPGTIGAARMADLNGDGLLDLVITECRGCGGGKMQAGFIYSFEAGFAAPTRIELPYPEIGAASELTLVDMDGAPGAEILVAGQAVFGGGDAERDARKLLQAAR